MQPPDFFTADPHFSHTNIIRYCGRPYTSITEMNDDLVDRWNSIVGEKDVVWVLGDLWSLDYIPFLNGEKHRFPGDHEKDLWRNKIGAQEKYLAAGFFAVYSPYVAMVGLPESVAVAHLPYVELDWNGEDRFRAMRPKDYGMTLLHGHVHTRWRKRGRMINVGVDAWSGYPVSLDEIRDTLRYGGDLSPKAWGRT